jgi:hypothetical protein
MVGMWSQNILGSAGVGSAFQNRSRRSFYRSALSTQYPSAMFNSPLSPLPSIEIDTPPGSPFPSVEQELGPPSVKRARTAFVCSEKTPTKRTRQYTGHSARGVQHPGIQLPDQLPPPDVSLASTASDSDSESDQRDDENDAYLRYVDLVLAGSIAIYQISRTVFVVQGWDSRCLSGTVSGLPTILKYRSDLEVEVMVSSSTQKNWR